MPQRDYILRLIEQFGQLALALRKLITGGMAGTDQVVEQLRGLARQAGVDLDIARRATPETLVLLAAPSGEVEPARCWMFAETLFLAGLDAEESGRLQEAWDSYLKARALFALLAPGGAYLVGFPEGRDRMEELEARLAKLEEAVS